MRITKRQLRRIIREAIDPREIEEPLGGWAGDASTGSWESYPAPGGEMAQADYAAGMLDAKSGRPMLPDANDDYAAGYEDGLVTLPLQELGKRWWLSRGECDTHNISPEDAAEAMAVLIEFNYELGLPPAVDSNNMAINDALAAYPGEFTYEDFECAIRVTRGRGA